MRREYHFEEKGELPNNSHGKAICGYALEWWYTLEVWREGDSIPPNIRNYRRYQRKREIGKLK